MEHSWYIEQEWFIVIQTMKKIGITLSDIRPLTTLNLDISF